jgi:hypothetical protein
MMGYISYNIFPIYHPVPGREGALGRPGDPAAGTRRRTSGEVLELRDEDDHITHTVHVRAEQRYTTIDLIHTETELAKRAEAVW